MKVACFAVALLAGPLAGALALAGSAGTTPARAWLIPITVLIAFALTPLARALARLLGAIDKPGGRKVHERPTPLLGGAAIYGAFTVAVLSNGVFNEKLTAVFVAATLVFAIGLVEDSRGVPALVRLLVQGISVAVLVRAGVVLTFLPPTWWGVALEWTLTFLWIVGITNAFNFLDGLDGLATGSAAVHAFFMGIYAYASGQMDLAFLSLALMAAALGFLPHNYKPHRRSKTVDIFLGDSGSTFLGFTLAALAVMGDWAEGSPKDLIVPVLILAVPIFDTVLTTVVRFREGLVTNFLEWILYTGRDHFHHRLLRLGLRKKEAVGIIYLVNVCLGISAFLLDRSGTADAFLVLGQVGILFGILGYGMVVADKRGRKDRGTATAATTEAA